MDVRLDEAVKSMTFDEKQGLTMKTVFNEDERDYDLSEHINGFKELEHLSILKDRHVIELFINQGAVTLTEMYHEVCDQFRITMEVKGSPKGKRNLLV